MALSRPVLALAALSFLVAAAPAAAADCATDADCPKGFACEEILSGDCPKAPDCPVGEICEPVACEPQTLSYCAPQPCTSKADCAEGLACVTETHEQCSGEGGCPVDGPCPPPSEPVCETISESFCAPRWVGACNVDADCGDGFRCEEEQACGCSGSAGSAGGAGNTEPPAEPDCTCTPTGELRCAMDVTGCSTQTDCPSGWTCEDNPEAGVCSSTPGGQATCEPADPAQVCLPPFWDLYAGGLDGDFGSASGNARDESTGGSTSTAGGSNSGSDGGCGCRVGAPPSSAVGAWLAAMAAMGLARTRRHRR